jgi:response regulator RpfG family c-di-GMP phosphodiesterase
MKINNDSEYFLISLRHLKRMTIFPFHLHIYNPNSDSYSPYLFANDPLTPDKKNLLALIEKKGGYLAVSLSQKITFLRALNLRERDIASLAQRPAKAPHPLELQRLEAIKHSELKTKIRGKFQLREELNLAADADNFTTVIQVAREELMTLPFTTSPTVSLANHFARNLLIEDNHINRIVSLSYHLSQAAGIKDVSAIGDLSCAAFISHIGHTMLDISYTTQAHHSLNERQQKTLEKHPALAGHLIKKSGAMISERCREIVNQHHERFDGSGPLNKKGPHIEPLALFLGASAHVVEIYTGRITGRKAPLRMIVSAIRKKTPMPGLEREFGQVIDDALAYLLPSSAA